MEPRPIEMYVCETWALTLKVEIKLVVPISGADSGTESRRRQKLEYRKQLSN